MDYNPVNINFDDGPVQGDYTMVTIGPYDYWAVEYGSIVEVDDDDDNNGDNGEDEKDEGQMLDGVPESFIGPLLKDVVMHEVGHTLGLRHNFKASSIHSIQEINTEEFKGQAQTASVMDYNPVNVNFNDGPVQGDYTMVTIGPYDYWAIEYGYTFEKDLKPILSRVSEKDIPYATDEDTWRYPSTWPSRSCTRR